jgi:hypothetical protein
MQDVYQRLELPVHIVPIKEALVDALRMIQLRICMLIYTENIKHNKNNNTNIVKIVLLTLEPFSLNPWTII